MVNYNGKPLSEFTLQELKDTLAHFDVVLAKRDEASKHEKFKKMPFPPPGAAFLKLKEAIEEEIKTK